MLDLFPDLLTFDTGAQKRQKGGGSLVLLGEPRTGAMMLRVWVLRIAEAGPFALLTSLVPLPAR